MILESNPSMDPEPIESDPSPQNPNPNPNDSDLETSSNPSKVPHPQELTFSYLCENPKLGFQDKDEAPNVKSKGIEVVASSSSPPPIERDFLQLKRENPQGTELEGREKKVKIETLGLSLAPPRLSLSLDTSMPLMPFMPPMPPISAMSVKTAMSAKTVNSDSFAHSMSYSQSVPFSHNPSCSLTRCSTEPYSMSKENDQMWYAGEGTNGSVHSKFRPVGDANIIKFVNPINELNANLGNKNINNSIVNDNFYKTTTSDNISIFPSELPPVVAKTPSSTSSMLTRPDRILKEIVSESVSVTAQRLQELPRESLEALKDSLRSLMETAEKKEEFLGLQRRLKRRPDLTLETLSRANKAQLEILVAIKTGIVGFISGKNRIPSSELIEIFLVTRCRNLRCQSLLPVDDCECKICTTEKGFCSACMCPICLKFDCASNTCSWVGCDVCSHWCHALCGLEKNIIRPGLNQKLGNGMTEMQFMCPGCDHASEMFGFVKEVFTCCAKDWGLDTLMKELDCVRMIFHVCEDFEGKELEKKATEMLTKLSKNQISPADACNGMLQFFKYGVSDLSVTGSSSKSILSSQPSPFAEPSNFIPPKPTLNLAKPIIPIIETQTETKPKLAPLSIESHFGRPPQQENDEGFESLETIVRLKEAEAKLFQRLADEARKEVEGYRRITKAKSEKIEEEYAAKIAKLCLKEAEEKRSKKLEELKFLENSHCDYQNMKGSMHAEIASLLQRMEATKKQWA